VIIVRDIFWTDILDDPKFCLEAFKFVVVEFAHDILEALRQRREKLLRKDNELAIDRMITVESCGMSAPNDMQSRNNERGRHWVKYLRVLPLASDFVHVFDRAKS
jgi:hypothetical protein